MSREKIREGLAEMRVAFGCADEVEVTTLIGKEVASAIFQYLFNNGVVLAVEGELPQPPKEPLTKLGNSSGWGRFMTSSPIQVWAMALDTVEKAGYRKTVPLIED